MGKRRLTELFVVGKDFTLDDGDGAETVWLQKLNQVQHAEAIRYADARRARALTLKRFPDSPEYGALMGSVLSIGSKKEKVDYLVAEHEAKVLPKREAEVADFDEWSKDGYLQSLKDAWYGSGEQEGLAVRYAKEPEDPEASRAFSELQRFDSAVKEILEDELDDIRTDLNNHSEEDLEEKIMDLVIDLQANSTWVDEFYRCQIWLGTRDPDDHRKMYFESRAEVDELSTDTYLKLRQAYEDMQVEIMEGKDLPGIPGSSPSSETSNAEEISASSGQQGAAA